jgi:molecular chaperone GrpE (heat shock protein)/glutathione synthase/RimK-type ligase-like ATP-grasp enzyme
MNKKISLIITSKEDSHADLVIYKLNQTGRGEEIVRLNTEDFAFNTEVTTDGANFEIKILDSQRFFNSQQIKSVWFRRPKPIEVFHAEEGAKAFIESQANAFLRGLYFCTHDTAQWINPLPSLHRSRIKLQQLQLAEKLRMSVPKTLVTNNYEKAIKFVRSLPKVCTKSLEEPNFTVNGHLFPLFTHIIDEQKVKENSEGINTCPTLFQEFIEKAYDLRVTIIGNQIFPLAIYSQENDLSRTDFRGLAPHSMKQEIVDIPDDLKYQIFQFVKHQGLVYSAMDFAVTADNQYIFLENNCNGQWQWVDPVADGALSNAMIDLLFDNNNQNNSSNMTNTQTKKPVSEQVDTYEDKKNQNEHSVTDTKDTEIIAPENTVAIEQLLKNLNNSFFSLQKDFETKIKYDQSKDSTIDALHRELQDYRDDLAFKTLRPLVEKLTRLTDQMRLLASNYEKTEQPVEARNVFKDLEDLAWDIEEAINDRGFEFFQTEDEVFDRKQQKAQKTVDTDNKELDKHICERIKVGLRYEEKVVRPELVSVYRYVASEKEQS